MPVQRIPRYRMLLQELVDNTLEEHPDSAKLTESLEEMKKVADFINHQMRISKSFPEIQKVIDKINAPQVFISTLYDIFINNLHLLVMYRVF